MRGITVNRIEAKQELKILKSLLNEHVLVDPIFEEIPNIRDIKEKNLRKYLDGFLLTYSKYRSLIKIKDQGLRISIFFKLNISKFLVTHGLTTIKTMRKTKRKYV